MLLPCLCPETGLFVTVGPAWEGVLVLGLAPVPLGCRADDDNDDDDVPCREGGALELTPTEYPGKIEII